MSVYDDFRKGHGKIVMDQRISCSASGPNQMICIMHYFESMSTWVLFKDNILCANSRCT